MTDVAWWLLYVALVGWGLFGVACWLMAWWIHDAAESPEKKP